MTYKEIKEVSDLIESIDGINTETANLDNAVPSSAVVKDYLGNTITSVYDKNVLIEIAQIIKDYYLDLKENKVEILKNKYEVYYCTTFPVFGAGELRAFADFMDWLRRNKINKMKLSKNPSNEVN